jgi:hypothetical protein
MKLSWARLRSSVLVLPLATAAAVVPLEGRASSTQAAENQLPVGVQWHAVAGYYDDAKRVRVLDAMRDAGVTWVRMDIGWDQIENQYPGQRDPYWIGRIDTFINMARARGIRPMVTLYQTPAWARPAGTSNRVPPSDPATYASFARWAAQHWAGRVAAWQVWNEPNLEEYWPGTDAARYTGLLRAAYPAFKAGDPTALVVAGAVSYNDDAWLRRMYEAGAAGSFDVLSTHPYQGPADAPPEVPDDGNRWHLTHVPAVRNLMVAYGDGAKPIWFTEFGYSTHPNSGSEVPWSRGVTDQQQADYLVRAIALTRSAYPYVTNFFIYNEMDSSSGSYHNDNYGLLRQDLSPKPAYHALRAYLGGQAAAPPAPGGTARNLLSSGQATFETSTAGWVADTRQATLSHTAATLGSAGGAAQLTASPAGAGMRSDVSRTPVSAGATYTAMISARARSQGRALTLFLNWFSASGAYLGQSVATASDGTGAWTPLRVTAAAPNAAASASITVQVERPAAGEAHLFDSAGLFPGNVSSWSAP